MNLIGSSGGAEDKAEGEVKYNKPKLMLINTRSPKDVNTSMNKTSIKPDLIMHVVLGCLD